MSWRRTHPAWLAALSSGLAASLLLGRAAERRMAVPASDGQALFAQDSGGRGGGPRTYQRIQQSGGQRSAAYGFQNFNKDRLEVSYAMPERQFREYNEAFGYRKEGLDDMKTFRENAYKSVYVMAARDHKTQEQLDAAVANVDKEYHRRIKEYLAQQGFKMLPGNVVAVDMPEIVRRNAGLMKPLSVSFDRVAQAHRYRSEAIIGAALSFVQTAMTYREPDSVYKGKHTGGLLPPITSVVLGWGDCDTKTGVLASLLSNWAQMRMVGVSVPHHYLMGVLLIPEKGDLFLEYQGLQYVLVEPAGPAWLPPGRVGDDTVTMLNNREGYSLEPFF